MVTGTGVEQIGHRIAVIDRQRGMVLEYAETMEQAERTARAWLMQDDPRCVDVLLVAPFVAGREVTVLHLTPRGHIVTRTGY